MTSSTLPPLAAPRADGTAVKATPGRHVSRERTHHRTAVAASPRVAMSSRQLTTAATLGVLAALALWLSAFALVFSRVQEQRSQTVLYAQLRQQLAEATAPLGGVIAAGRPVAIIDAPAAGLRRQVVVEGTTAHELTRGPGHLVGTPLPGQPGVAVLFGRSVLYAAPFGKLPALRQGAALSVTTGQGTFRFQVKDVRYPGDPLPAPVANGAARLTLVTSVGTGWRAGWAPQQALYVDADLVGKPVGAPPAVNVGRRVDEGPLQGDYTRLVLLVVLLHAGLLLTAASIWGTRRVGALPTLVLASPLGVALLWAASDAMAQLLPNLI